MESGYDYPERSDDNQAEVCENAKAERDVRIRITLLYRQKSAEVIVSRQRAATYPHTVMQRTHIRTKD